MRVRKEYKLTCIDCAGIFIAFRKGALRCEECKKEHLRRVKAANQARYRQAEYVPNSVRKKPPKMSIRELIRATANYNKANNTYISEGKFALLVEQKIIKAETYL